MSEFHSAVVKITGNAFKPGNDDEPKRLATELSELKAKLSGELVVCVGGGDGNRGRDAGAVSGIDRLMADRAGMMASAANATRLCIALGDNAVGFSGIARSTVLNYATETSPEIQGIGLQVVHDTLTFEDEVAAREAAASKAEGIIVVGGGINRGNVSTDTGAALWASGLVAPGVKVALLKGTNQRGVYARDPEEDPDADFFSHLSYQFAKNQELNVIDPTAWPILIGTGVSTIVYKDGPGNMAKALDRRTGSVVDDEPMKFN